MSTDDILSLIDGAIGDYTASEDAMRWKPEPSEDEPRDEFCPCGHDDPDAIWAAYQQYEERQMGEFMRAVFGEGQPTVVGGPPYRHWLRERATSQWTVEIGGETFPVWDVRFEPGPDPIAGTWVSDPAYRPFAPPAGPPAHEALDPSHTFAGPAAVDLTPREMREVEERLRPHLDEINRFLLDGFNDIRIEFAPVAENVLGGIREWDDYLSTVLGDEPAIRQTRAPRVPGYRDDRPRHESPYGPRARRR